MLALIIAGATIGAAAHAQTTEAQTTEADDTPAADTEMAPDQTAADEPEPMFDEPVDLTVPVQQPANAFDPSRFTRGLPTPVWTSRAGIDDREGTPNAEVRPGHGLPGTTPEQAVGIAWANISAPGLMLWDRSAIETRIDPYQQSRFGMTLSRSVPVGDVALTLQNTFAWTQPLFQGAPVMAHGGHVVEGNHAVRFTYLPFGTTFSIGTTGSSAEEGWRRSLSAEQQLLGGPLSITGTVSETGTGELDRSLKARFRRSW
jgi:hypothetical protein